MKGFYAVVDAADERLVASLIEGGASVVQLRMKKASSVELVDAARAVRGWTRGRVPFVVNDRLDVALLVGADGVHLGQDDLPVAAARGRGLLVGVSTHDLAQVRAAVAAGADYLGFGPVYETTTKENPDPVQGVGELAKAVAAAQGVPVVAIGGVTPERAPEIAAAGAAAACAISSVNRAPDVVAAARRIAAAFLCLALCVACGKSESTAPPGAEPALPRTPPPRAEPKADPAVDDAFVDLMVQIGTVIDAAGGDCVKLGEGLEAFSKQNGELIERVRESSLNMTPDEKMAMHRRIASRIADARPKIVPAVKKCGEDAKVQAFAEWFLR